MDYISRRVLLLAISAAPRLCCCPPAFLLLCGSCLHVVPQVHWQQLARRWWRHVGERTAWLTAQQRYTLRCWSPAGVARAAWLLDDWSRWRSCGTVVCHCNGTEALGRCWVHHHHVVATIECCSHWQSRRSVAARQRRSVTAVIRRVSVTVGKKVQHRSVGLQPQCHASQNVNSRRRFFGGLQWW